MTIKDLARESGYSLGTVSRVLNGQPNVSEKARRAVMAVVEAKGFEVNPNARNLKMLQSDAVLVVVKGRGNELFAAMVEQYQAIFAQAGVPLLIDYMDELDDEVRRAEALCREKKPQGILFLGGSQQNFQEGFSRIAVPSVLVTGSARGLGFPNLSSVAVDDCHAAKSAVSYLLEAGHRQVVVLGGDRQRSDISRQRYQGCQEAFRQWGVSFSEERGYFTCRYSYQDGYDAMNRALRQGAECTAVFAMADVIAIGAVRAIRDAGLRVPEDLSVMGYDGLAIGSYLHPRLSTVVQPTEAMARRSAELLLRQVRQGGTASHETVPFTLAQRESVFPRG